MSDGGIEARLEKFLAQFPDNATCWSQATDELPEMYIWISKDGARFVPVGRENCHTPAEWNQKYKAAIRAGISQLDATTKQKFADRFSYWIDGGTP